jgi:DNA-binding transcriptional MerR regulator
MIGVWHNKMKLSEVARLLGVDPATVKSWASQEMIASFLSPGARGDSGRMQREFTQSDADALNTIRHLKSKNRFMAWDEITEVLKNGTRITEYPQSAIDMDSRVISVQHAETGIELAKVVAERDALRQRVNELEVERKEYVQEVKELYRQIGNLEAQIKLNGKIDPNAD